MLQGIVGQILQGMITGYVLQGVQWHTLQKIGGHLMACVAGYCRALHGVCCSTLPGMLQGIVWPQGPASPRPPRSPPGIQPYLGAGSTSWPRGAWQGLGEDRDIRALCPAPTTAPQLPSPHVAPDARGKDFPCSVSSPAELICLVLPQGEGEFGATKRWQTALTLGPAFPGNPGGPRAPVSPCWEEKRTKPHTKTPNPNPSFLSRVSAQ